MAKSISCADAGKDCGWSATAETEDKLMTKVAEHVASDHKEIELTPENIEKVKSLSEENNLLKMQLEYQGRELKEIKNLLNKLIDQE